MMELIIQDPIARDRALQKIRSRSIWANAQLIARVASIIEGVRSGGDQALLRYTKEFDGIELAPEQIRLTAEEIRRAASRADPRVVEDFARAIGNIRDFHRRQLELGWEVEPRDGARLGVRILPIARVGLYIPGGRAAYPSSVIMNAVPAQVAGVEQLAAVMPPMTLERAPAVAAVLVELGLEEVYQVGGAQAIAALAFGTQTIPRVDKIAGPGNIYVAIAKKLVYGAVGIDSIAGPTEVVILADDSARPEWVAADMLAQAEHDPEAAAISITTGARLARQIARELEAQLQKLERTSIARDSISRYGAIFVVTSLEEGCELVNQIAPEHLELMTSDDERAAGLIQNAGAIFFGQWSPEPVGDYIAGPNHVLPTMGTARFSSPLGVYDFLKRQSVIRYSRARLLSEAEAIARMARAEGLTAHGRAVLIRFEEQAP
jgi:histidinol dehydrogenase